MSIAVWTAADTACRVTIAKLATTLVVSAPGAELCAVEGDKQSLAAHLPRDRGQCILGTGRAGGGVLRGIVHARAGAAVGVAHHYAPKLVHGDVVEVEQVSTWVAAALVPNAAAPHGIGRCRVGGGPGATAVVRERDIQMPDAEEIGRLRVASRGGAEECISRTVVISCDDLGEFRILHSEWRARVLGLGPVQPAVLGHGDFRVPIHVDVTEVDGIVRACCDGRVTAGADALGIRHGPHDPVQAVVDGDGRSWPADAVRVHALLVGNVGCTARRDASVSVQATASAGSNGAIHAADSRKEVDRNTRPEGEAAVITPRAEGGHDVL